MGIASVTYKSVIDLVKTYLATNCNNIGNNFSAMPACFKSGWTGTAVVIAQNKMNVQNTNRTYTITTTPYISSNGISYNPTAETVNGLLDQYIQGLGITQTDIIPVKNFPAFFDNLLSFCCRYVVFYTSQYAPSSVMMIFSDTSNNQTYTSSADEKIYAKQANDILTVLDVRLHLLARKKSVQHGYSYSETLA